MPLEGSMKNVTVSALFGVAFAIASTVSTWPLLAAEPQRSQPMEREVITLGGGCFWCMGAVFLGLKGVVSVESGFSGGTVETPSYKLVCTGSTGHAEVVQVTFDPKVVSLHDILEVFFALHDPTTV